MRPDHFARLSVEQIKLHRHACGDAPGVDLLEVVKPAPDHKLSRRIAPQLDDGLIITRASEHANQSSPDQIDWRLRPLAELIRANLIDADAIRNRRVLKYLGSVDVCNYERDRVRTCRERGRRGNLESVIPDGLGASTRAQAQCEQRGKSESNRSMHRIPFRCPSRIRA